MYDEINMVRLLIVLGKILYGEEYHFHCPYCCGLEADYHTWCFYELDEECTEGL